MSGAALRLAVVLIGLAALAPEASATETLTYSYDALGRLVKVARSGTVNNGASECYAYDRADNRSNVAVSTTSDCSAPPVSFSVNDVSVTEGGNLAFTVTKSGTTTGTTTVNYATANGTATAGSDYSTTSGTLSFAATETSKTVSVATTDDTLVESDETVLLNLSNATGGATIGDAQGVGTIKDNDGAATCSGVSFSVSNASAVEASPLNFTVTKAGTTSSSCSVNYATADGTAIAPGDYTGKSGTLTFSAAQSSQTVSVTTNSNALNPEPDETVYLNLSGATGGATITDSQGVGTIVDDGLGGGGQCNPICPIPNGSPTNSTTPTDPTTGAAPTTDPTTTDPSPAGPGA